MPVRSLWQAYSADIVRCLVRRWWESCLAMQRACEAARKRFRSWCSQCCRQSSDGGWSHRALPGHWSAACRSHCGRRCVRSTTATQERRIERSGRRPRSRPFARQPWLAPALARALFFKRFLHGGIGLARHGCDFAELHAHAMKKLPDLGWASLDPGQSRYRWLCFSYRGGRFPTEMSFERLSILVQLAMRPVWGHLLEGLHSSRDVLLQVRKQRVLRDISDPANLTMRQLACFQPQRPHLLLNPRVWMMQSLEFDGFDRFGVERDS